MSFESRDITINFTLSKSDFGDGNNSLTVSGLRVEAQIDNAGGINGSTLYAKIYGMKEADMLKCCTYAQTYQIQKNIMVTLLAGDVVSGMSQIFQGTITDGMIDYNEMPHVPLVIQCRSGFLEQILPSAPNSSVDPTDVAAVIASLAKAIGFAFTNAGVTKYLGNHYSYGSPVQQIKDIARAAGIGLDISNNQVAIWAAGTPRDTSVVSVSPSSGLIGYPTYYPWGVMINTSFTPDMVRGRKCSLISAVEKANGDFFIQAVTHLLSSQLPGGPWMTTTQLTLNETVGA